MADSVIKVDEGIVKFNIFRVHRPGEILAVNLNAFWEAQPAIVRAPNVWFGGQNSILALCVTLNFSW